MDLDGDGQVEMILDCVDTLVFRYTEEKIFCYPLGLHQMTGLYTDGSYSWAFTGQYFAYGTGRLSFEGNELIHRELTRVMNDGTPDATFCIEGEEVTREEFSAYMEENPKTAVTYIPLQADWQNAISRGEAKQIAAGYWSHWSSQTGYRVEKGTNPHAPDKVYVFLIRKSVMGHDTTIDEIWIDKTTGECVVPHGDDEGK